MEKLYIETSVVSYHVSERSENIRIASRQIATNEIWENLSKFEVFISDMVVEEASKGNQGQANLRLEAIKDFIVLEINDKVEALARLLVSKNAIPPNSPEDALHIAAAAVNAIDFLVTWNFKHINNPFMKNKIRGTIEAEGYKYPVICSPDELLGGDDE